MTVYRSVKPPTEEPVQPPRRRRGHGQWLLSVPLVLALLTPLYNRIEPRLFGVPFFYWYQLALVAVDVAVITVVYQLGKDR